MIAIVLTIQAFAFGTQQRISVNGGLGYDGSNYHEIAEQIRAGEPPRGVWRFARRVGTPLLVAVIGGDDLIGTFQTINACAAFASALLLLAWLRRYLDSAWLRIALVVVYATHWLQLVRFTAFYPVLVDACAQTCCFAGLHVIASYEKQPAGWKVVLVSLVSVAGVLFREAVLLIPLAFLFVRNPGIRFAASFPHVRLTNVAHLTPWIPIVLAGTALALVDSFVIATDAEFAASRHLLARASSRSVLTFGLGWLVAFGPALFLVLFDWRAVVAFFGRHRWMAAYIAGVAAIGWAGSLESERHALYWGAPLVYVLVGRSVARHGPWLKRSLALPLILVAQLLVNRVFWSVPQPGDGGAPAIVLTPVGPATTYLHLFPDYLPRDVALLQLFQHAAVGVVILVVMRSMTTRPD